MSEQSIAGTSFSEAPPRISEFRRVVRVCVRRRLSLIGFIIIFLAILVAVIAPLIESFKCKPT
jgi:hypothetical protein